MNDGLARHVIAVTGLAWEARIARGPGVRCVTSGARTDDLASSLSRAISPATTALMSFGIAAGFTEALRPGSFIVARNVVTATERIAASAAWIEALTQRLRGVHVVDVLGSDAIVLEPSAKRALHASTGAGAVDTESHVVAQVARLHALPWAVFRVVCDPVGRGLPPAARVGLNARGEIDHAAVLRSLLRAPAQLVPLARTALDAAIAMRALSRGRRHLGAGLGYPDLGELLVDVA